MDNPFMRIQGDQENETLIVQAYKAMRTGMDTVPHLGRSWKAQLYAMRKQMRVPSYLQTLITVDAPDTKGKSKVRIDFPHIVHEEGNYSLRGMVVPNRNSDLTSFLFNDRTEFVVRTEMAKKLIASGKLSKTDLAGILSDKELGAL